MSISQVVSASSIKPIETFWKGYRFRSRLEARWAVFFETLGLHWEYEKEGFILPSGNKYLPDFYIYGLGFFEIKPLPNDFKGGAVWPAKGSPEFEFFLNNDGGILYGIPGPVNGFEYHALCPYVGSIVSDGPYFFCECPDCKVIGFEFDGRSARVNHDPKCKANTGDKGYNTDSPRLLKAAVKSRAARFEHGERP